MLTIRIVSHLAGDSEVGHSSLRNLFGGSPHHMTHPSPEQLYGTECSSGDIWRAVPPMESDMHKYITKLLAVLAVFFALAATPASAQATRTWISGVGDDANPCSRTAPCKTFAGAITKTAANGEINVLDPGGFGGVTITKSITLRGDGELAGMLVAGTSGIIINAAATDRIILDGLDIEGLGPTGNSTNGINILSARDVIVRNTSIRGFQNAASGIGISVNSTNKVTLIVENSFIGNNRIGVSVTAPGLSSSARIYNSVLAVNSVAGIRVTGAGNTAQISGNIIERSPKSLDLTGGGTATSYGDNILSGTATDTPTIIPKG
jgi:Right handed beta helix region